MNRFARDIIIEFSSKENIDFIRGALNNHFRNQRVYRYLEDYLDNSIEHFVQVVEQELMLSDPLPGTTIYDQVNGFNNQFIQDHIRFIKSHVTVEDEVPMYVVKDGLPTSRGVKTYQKRADDILQTWRCNSGRGVQLREDTAGDIYPNNPYYGQGDQQLETGIVFCDQSELGTQNHYEQYHNRSYMRAMNSGHLPHEETAFGVSTPAADARLLSRRIFRGNEAGVENGISRTNARLHNRHLERDISEGLRGVEKGCMVYGHDMSSLYKRIDHKNNVRRHYEPTCDNSRDPHDMRYL